jgi:signal transduction histidine kinase
VSEPVVLVISETPGFFQTILDRWQLDPNLPLPTAMRRALCGKLAANSFDLAIIEGWAAHELEALLAHLEPHGKALLVLVSDAPTAELVFTIAPSALVVQQAVCSIATLLLVAAQVVQRIQAVARLRVAEEALVMRDGNALVGRYITEMRHTINNALTSVMGNSELLLFEPGALSAHHRSQIETIRTMSIRIHEIMQRLGSLETEMKWMEQQKHHDQRRKQVRARG